jgi:hypothetical protein
MYKSSSRQKKWRGLVQSEGRAEDYKNNLLHATDHATLHCSHSYIYGYRNIPALLLASLAFLPTVEEYKLDHVCRDDAWKAVRCPESWQEDRVEEEGPGKVLEEEGGGSTRSCLRVFGKASRRCVRRSQRCWHAVSQVSCHRSLQTPSTSVLCYDVLFVNIALTGL